MKLRHITGWGLHRSPGSDPTRLVVYADTQTAPVYVSEVVSMPDPEFRGVDLSRLGRPGRAARIAVRVFKYAEKWQLIHQAELSLDNAQPWVVDSDFGSQTGPIVVFTVRQHWMWVPETAKPPSDSVARPEALRPVSTLSFDKLVKLHTLETCLQDSYSSEAQLATEIDTQLPQSTVHITARLSELARRLKLLNSSISQTTQATARLRSEAARILDKSAKTQKYLANWTESWPKLPTEKLLGENVDDPTDEAVNTSSSQSEIAEDIKQARRKLIRGLMEIFPIEPIEKSFHFTICGLPMPSVFSINHYDPIQVGAVLGLIAQLVVLLSRYLGVALPYPIHPYGSQSYILDTVNKLQGSRTFPLWTKGALLYRVEYGLYLLHKNIEQLMISQNLAVADLKQTLANLKNLMLVCS